MTPQEYRKLPVETFNIRMSSAEPNKKWNIGDWVDLDEIRLVVKQFTDVDLCVLWEYFNSPELHGTWPPRDKMSAVGNDLVSVLQKWWPIEEVNTDVRDEMMRRFLVKHTTSDTLREQSNDEERLTLKRKIDELEDKTNELHERLRDIGRICRDTTK